MKFKEKMEAFCYAFKKLTYGNLSVNEWSEIKKKTETWHSDVVC